MTRLVPLETHVNQVLLRNNLLINNDILYIICRCTASCSLCVIRIASVSSISSFAAIITMAAPPLIQQLGWGQQFVIRGEGCNIWHCRQIEGLPKV
jgi:hypothetical protein